MPAVSGLAGVLVTRARRRRVDGADRDAVRVLDDLDLHLVGIGPARRLPRVHDCLTAGRSYRADIAVHAFHLEPFAPRDAAVPVETLSARADRSGRAEQDRDHETTHRFLRTGCSVAGVAIVILVVIVVVVVVLLVVVVAIVVTVPRALVLPRLEIDLAGPPQLDVAGKGLELEPRGVAAAAEGEGEAMFAGAHRVHGKAGIEVAVEGGDRSGKAGAERNHDRDVAVVCPQAVAATGLDRAVIEDVAVHGVDFNIRGVDARQRDVAVHRLDRDVAARVFDADVTLDGVHLDTAARLGKCHAALDRLERHVAGASGYRDVALHGFRGHGAART